MEIARAQARTLRTLRFDQARTLERLCGVKDRKESLHHLLLNHGVDTY